MGENLSYRLDTRSGWGAISIPTVLAVEDQVWTAGDLKFLNGENVNVQDLYLLEFYVEIKTVLVQYFGSKSFSQGVPLTLSRRRMKLIRTRETMQLLNSNEQLLDMPWDEFMWDFIDFSRKLKNDIRSHFPEIPNTSNFHLFFGPD